MSVLNLDNVDSMYAKVDFQKKKRDKAIAEDCPLENTTPGDYKNKQLRLPNIIGNENKESTLKLTNISEKNDDVVYSKIYREDRSRASAIPKGHSVCWRSKFYPLLVILVIFMLVLCVSLIVIAASYFNLELSELKTELLDTMNYTISANETSQHEAIHSSCKQAFQLQGTSFPGCCRLKPSSDTPKPAYYSWTVPCSNITGRWTRVAKLNNCNGIPLCFDNLAVSNITNTSGCVAMNITTPGCASVTFSTPPGLLYSHICGIVRGVAYGSPDGFKNGTHIYSTTYVDGISFILPKEQPIRHVFTFSAYGGTGKTFPCNNNVPKFVHDDYQCMVTVHNSTCPITDNCSPSFHRDFRKLTSGDIEMRICRDQDSDDEEIILKDLELYIL